MFALSLFILKAAGTASSFFQYLKVTGNHIVNSIIYFGLLLMKFEVQFNLEGAQNMLCAFSTDGFAGNHLCHRLCFLRKCFSGYLSKMSNIMMAKTENQIGL